MPKVPRRGRQGLARFAGYSGPNYTMVPDELFDQQLPDLSGAELKVLLYIIRRTFGFKKDRDNISLSQMLDGIKTRDGRILDRGVGLTKKTLLQALRSLEGRSIILTERRRSPEKGNEPTTYRLNVLSSPLGGETTPPLGEKVHQGDGGEITPSPRGNNSPTQETVEQETGQHTSKLRRRPTLNRSSGTTTVAGEVSELIEGFRPAGLLRTDALEGEAASLSAVAPPTGVDGHATATLPARRLLRARLPPEERRRYDADRRQVVDYLSDFARELGDGAPLASSVSRAVNLMHRAGVDLEAFVQALYHARAVTKERWAAVRKERKRPGDPFPRKEAMAYFFAELEHALGLRVLPETPAAHAARKETEGQERERERGRYPDWARATGPRAWVQTYKPGGRLPGLGTDGA